MQLHQLNYGKIKVEDKLLEGVSAEKIAAQRRWEAYIAAMRGFLSSHPLDVNKVNAHIARMRAEDRFFSDREMGRARRRALLLQLILSRSAGSYGG